MSDGKATKQETDGKEVPNQTVQILSAIQSLPPEEQRTALLQWQNIISGLLGSGQPTAQPVVLGQPPSRTQPGEQVIGRHVDTYVSQPVAQEQLPVRTQQDQVQTTRGRTDVYPSHTASQEHVSIRTQLGQVYSAYPVQQEHLPVRTQAEQVAQALADTYTVQSSPQEHGQGRANTEQITAGGSDAHPLIPAQPDRLPDKSPPDQAVRGQADIYAPHATPQEQLPVRTQPDQVQLVAGHADTYSSIPVTGEHLQSRASIGEVIGHQPGVYPGHSVNQEQGRTQTEQLLRLHLPSGSQSEQGVVRQTSSPTSQQEPQENASSRIAVTQATVSAPHAYPTLSVQQDQLPQRTLAEQVPGAQPELYQAKPVGHLEHIISRAQAGKEIVDQLGIQEPQTGQQEGASNQAVQLIMNSHPQQEVPTTQPKALLPSQVAHLGLQQQLVMSSDPAQHSSDADVVDQVETNGQHIQSQVYATYQGLSQQDLRRYVGSQSSETGRSLTPQPEARTAVTSSVLLAGYSDPIRAGQIPPVETTLGLTSQVDVKTAVTSSLQVGGHSDPARVSQVPPSEARPITSQAYLAHPSYVMSRSHLQPVETHVIGQQVASQLQTGQNDSLKQVQMQQVAAHHGGQTSQVTVYTSPQSNTVSVYEEDKQDMDQGPSGTDQYQGHHQDKGKPLPTKPLAEAPKQASVSRYYHGRGPDETYFMKKYSDVPGTQQEAINLSSELSSAVLPSGLLTSSSGEATTIQQTQNLTTAQQQVTHHKEPEEVTGAEPEEVTGAAMDLTSELSSALLPPAPLSSDNAEATTVQQAQNSTTAQQQITHQRAPEQEQEVSAEPKQEKDEYEDRIKKLEEELKRLKQENETLKVFVPPVVTSARECDGTSEGICRSILEEILDRVAGPPEVPMMYMQPPAPPKRKRGRPPKHKVVLKTPSVQIATAGVAGYLTGGDSYKVPPKKRKNPNPRKVDPESESNNDENVDTDNYRKTRSGRIVRQVEYTENDADSGEFEPTKLRPLRRDSRSNAEAPLPIKKQRLQISPYVPVKRHKKIVRHMCKLCDKRFTHGRPFNRHLQQRHDWGPVSCRKCKQEYSSEAVFLHHSCPKTMKKRQVRHCRFCSQKFTNFKKLQRHMKSVHNVKKGDPEVFCKYCEKGFVKKSSLYVHLKEHAEDKVVCLKCGHFCDNEAAHQAHMEEHERNAPYNCDKCGICFERRQQYHQHLMGHDRYDCSICDQVFSRKKLLVQHCKMLHGIKIPTTNKKYACTECGKLYPRPGMLELHMRLHTGEKPIECEVCKMYFRTPKALAKHQQTFTHLTRAGEVPQERRHLCALCGKAYFRKQALQRHMRYHTDEKPFFCPHCSYNCREHNNLKRHIALHFSRRDFICETCGAAFHAKKTLETHKLYKHSEEREFQCDECPMTFKTNSSLRRHLRIHANTRQHKCPGCGVGFNRLYNLRRHMRSVHGNDDTLPPVKRVMLLDAQPGKEYAKGPAALGLQGKPSGQIRVRKPRQPKQPIKQEVPQAAIPQPVQQTVISREASPIHPLYQNTATATAAAAYAAENPPLSHVIHLTTGHPMAGGPMPPTVTYAGEQAYMQPASIPAGQLEVRPEHHIERTEYPQDLYAAVPSLLQLMHSNAPLGGTQG